jgi:hypothetical protein
MSGHSYMAGRGGRGQFDRLDDRGIIVLRLVDPCRDRPHPHWLGREWPHQVMRIGFIAQPAHVICGREDERHTIVDTGHQFVGVSRNYREGAGPLACGRVFPVLPQSAKAKRAAILHGDSIGLLGFLSLDRLPFKEVHPPLCGRQRDLYLRMCGTSGAADRGQYGEAGAAALSRWQLPTPSHAAASEHVS